MELLKIQYRDSIYYDMIITKEQALSQATHYKEYIVDNYVKKVEKIQKELSGEFNIVNVSYYKDENEIDEKIIDSYRLNKYLRFIYIVQIKKYDNFFYKEVKDYDRNNSEVFILNNIIRSLMLLENDLEIVSESINLSFDEKDINYRFLRKYFYFNPFKIENDYDNSLIVIEFDGQTNVFKCATLFPDGFDIHDYAILQEEELSIEELLNLLKENQLNDDWIQWYFNPEFSFPPL